MKWYVFSVCQIAVYSHNTTLVLQQEKKNIPGRTRCWLGTDMALSCLSRGAGNTKFHKHTHTRNCWQSFRTFFSAAVQLLNSCPSAHHWCYIILYDTSTDQIYTIISQVKRLKLLEPKEIMMMTECIHWSKLSGRFQFILYVRWAAGSHIRKLSNFRLYANERYKRCVPVNRCEMNAVTSV